MAAKKPSAGRWGWQTPRRDKDGFRTGANPERSSEFIAWLMASCWIPSQGSHKYERKQQDYLLQPTRTRPRNQVACRVLMLLGALEAGVLPPTSVLPTLCALHQPDRHDMKVSDAI